jgi:acetylornithine deacetylase/succinyl-diaminopimelate desuccinylase-like protein
MDEDALLRFARDLIAIPTENPPGRDYERCVERIRAELDALDIPHETVETGDADTRRQTILGRVGDAGPFLYLHGHYDVVPAFGEEQFEPRVEDGFLLGRGSSDMKGGLAAIVHAARGAAEAGVRVALVIVPDEETGGRLGAERLAELGLLDPSAAGAIVAEPTWGTVWHACRGAYTLNVVVRGRPAHVGLHYEGVNAFANAVEVMVALRELESELRDRRSALAFASDDPRAAESILLVGGVAGGGTNFNVVPAEFAFTVDRRPNPDEDYDGAKEELLAVLEACRGRGIDLSWDVLQDAHSAETPAGSDFAGAVVDAAADVSRARPSITCCPGVLEIRVYTRLGIPAVAFGPGLIGEMHGPDERVPVANLAAAVRIYGAAASRIRDLSNGG